MRLPFRESLDGSPNQAAIDFDCLYESYDEDHSPGWRQRDSSPQEQPLSWQSLPKNRYQSRDSRDSGHGVLSVRVIAAYDLMNTDTGFFGDVSDPYVTVRLESQSEKQQKRTHTINNDLNPRWNSSPFLFPVELLDYFEHESLLLFFLLNFCDPVPRFAIRFNYTYREKLGHTACILTKHRLGAQDGRRSITSRGLG